MIAYLNGTIKFISRDHCILDVGGVGFKIFTITNSLQLNHPSEFFIHTSFSDNSINLFGFQNRDAFELFELLLTVSGFGAKSALAILSKISPADFASAILNQNLDALTKLPGVGKKSAQRILLELKEKIQTMKLEYVTQSPAQADATQALEALGYTKDEIRTVLDNAPPQSSTNSLIKFALKFLSS